jgi:uncharacterized protein with HEPN domain
MYDQTLVLDILRQIDGALRKVQERSSRVASAEALTATPDGEERLDGLCMLFIAIGESLKNLDKITAGELLAAHPEIDWKGAMGFRDVIAHRYLISTPSRCGGSAPRKLVRFPRRFAG